MNAILIGNLPPFVRFSLPPLSFPSEWSWMLPDTPPIFPDNSCDAPRLSASSHHPFQHGQHPFLPAVTQSPAHAQSAAVQHPPVKKRRTDRACDGCRRKKTRCDGPWSTNYVCSNCSQAKKPCTYIEASKPRGPPKAYVTGLEDRVEELEALLAQIKPGTDFSDELGPPVLRDSWKIPGIVVEPPRRPATDSPSRVATPQDGESQRTSAPAASPLPPLMIPFHRPKSESNLSFKSTSFKSTHLFSRRRLLKTKGSTAFSDLTLSSGSGSSPIPNRAGPSHQSASSYASSSDSEYGSHDYSDSDSEEIVETSAVGRSRYTLKMNETPQVEDNRIIFHGRSSTAGLVEATRIFKHMHMQETMGMDITKDHEGDVKREEDELNGKLKIKIEGPDNSRVAMNRRPVFWQTPPWELKYQAITAQSPLTTIPHILSQFPPPDLCRTLIKLYFFHCNNHFPLLHRPTFERQWEEKLYERNAWHACLCLLIFAVASRWCEDVRVLADHNSPSTPSDWTKAGWKYFEAGTEIHRVARSLFNSPTLFEIQTFTLMGMFLRGTQFAPIAWFIVSAGLRKAQDAGAHRKRTYHQQPNTDDELWKRAFWLLIVFDRVGGVLLGRGIGIGEEDFDLELPLEVDDEFWSNDTEWKQPEGRPSIISSFNQLIKLTQIIAFAAKTVYAIDKPKIFRGLIEGDWRVEVITQLNTAMDEWLDNVPNQLKWSEDLPDSNSVFYAQSAMLYSTYHVARTLIYRPFIPVPPLLPPSMQRHHKESTPALTPFPFPALAICVTSARACTRIIEAQFRKKSWNHLNIPSFTSAAFTCAGTMILALWDLKAQQRVLVKVKNVGIISSETEVDDGSSYRDGNARAGTEELKADALLSSLKQKMENIICEVNILLEALEWLQDRWENSSSFLSQLKESLPSAQDLQSDLELSDRPDRLSIVKQLSFQDLRRQRQQAQQEKLQKKQSMLSLDGQSGNEATLNTQKMQWLKSDANNSTSQLDPTSQSKYEGVHQPTVQGGEPYPSVEPRIEPVDVDRFLQDHYTDLHTFADDDFDPSPESSIQLPTIPYSVSPAGHHSSRCQCPDCSGPPSRVSSTEFGNAAAQEQYPRYQQEDQQRHYQPPSNHPYRDKTQIRIHPPSTSSFSFRASTPFSMCRSSTTSGPPVQDVSLRRASHDNPGQGLHPRHDSVTQPMPSPLPVPSPVMVDTSAMPMSVPISMNRPISSLDGYSMHGQQQRRATSNERGSPFDGCSQIDMHHVQNKYMHSQLSPSMARRPYTEYPPHTGQAWRTPNESPSSFSSFGPDGQYHEWQSTAVPQSHVASTTTSIYQPSLHPNTSQIRLSQHPDAVHDISQQPQHSFPVSHRQYPPPRPDMGYGPMSTDFSS